MDCDRTLKAHIRVQNLSKTFSLAAHSERPVSLLDALRKEIPFVNRRKIRAVDDVSFEVGEGERVAIIGRNGAGKTSLLSILAGVAQPTSGEVNVVGDVHAMLTIGAVLREEATGRENIYLDGAVHGREREEMDAHVAEIVSFSELNDFIDRPVRTYSSGMKARLAFSMGVFVHPDILIIDETLSVGDAFFVVKARKKMRQLTDSGRIVLMVSHSLGTIVEMCTRCLWMERGRLIMDGEPKAVTSAYQTAVQQSDERDLRKKFSEAKDIERRVDTGRVDNFILQQNGADLSSSARCQIPLMLKIDCWLNGGLRDADLELTITRVDGRLIWHRSLSGSGNACSPGSFQVTVQFSPFLLGAGLFKIDATLRDDAGIIDVRSRILETIDDEGQFGGVPLMLCPPQIASRKVGIADA